MPVVFVFRGRSSRSHSYRDRAVMELLVTDLSLCRAISLVNGLKGTLIGDNGRLKVILRLYQLLDILLYDLYTY